MRIEVVKIGEFVDIHFQIGLDFKDCLNLSVPQAEQILHNAFTGKLFTEEEKKLEEEKAKDEEIRKGKKEGVPSDKAPKDKGLPSDKSSGKQGADRLSSLEFQSPKVHTGKKQSDGKPKGKKSSL